MPLLKQRFDSKWKLVEGGCWRWTDVLAANGYGYLGIGGRKGRHVQAHRLAYELYVGPIPEGLWIDHLCRNRWCVNPGHLEPVTPQVNLLRGETVTAHHAAQTHCLRGHPLPSYKAGKKRQCRKCAQMNQNQRRKRRRLSLF